MINYLNIREARTGHEWTLPIGDFDDLAFLPMLKRWLAAEYPGFEIEEPLMPRLEGAYYATLMVDAADFAAHTRSCKCWTAAGFFVKETD